MGEGRPRRHQWGGCRWRRGFRFEARDCDGRTAFQQKRSGSSARGCLNLKAGLGFLTQRRKDAEDAEGEQNRGGGWVHPMGERPGTRVCSLPLRSLRLCVSAFQIPSSASRRRDARGPHSRDGRAPPRQCVFQQAAHLLPSLPHSRSPGGRGTGRRFLKENGTLAPANAGWRRVPFSVVSVWQGGSFQLAPRGGITS